MRIILFLFLAIVAGFVLMAIYLPWWGILGALLAIAILLRVIGKWILVSLFTLPFKAKGAVLRGATAKVNSVQPAVPPPPPARKPGEEEGGDEDEAKENASRRWYHVDVTITPLAPQGSFTLWEAGELRLVRPEANAKSMLKDEDPDSDISSLHKVEIYRDGQFGIDEPGKYPGEQRLRLYVGILPGHSKLKFRYYFEHFGEVSFPG